MAKPLKQVGLGILHELFERSSTDAAAAGKQAIGANRGIARVQGATTPFVEGSLEHCLTHARDGLVIGWGIEQVACVNVLQCGDQGAKARGADRPSAFGLVLGGMHTLAEHQRVVTRAA